MWSLFLCLEIKIENIIANLTISRISSINYTLELILLTTRNVGEDGGAVVYNYPR